MFRLVAILAIATIVVATPPAIKVDKELVQVLIVKDLAEAKALYPNAEFTKLEKQDKGRGPIRYTLGNRINGDRLVAQGADGQKWSSPQNIQLSLKYPNSGQGAVVTYVQIDVNQSSNSGQGYVVSGGIGQRSIGIVIEAYSTTFFEYAAYIYGY